MEQGVPCNPSRNKWVFRFFGIIVLNGILAGLAQIGPFLVVMIALAALIWVAIPAMILWLIYWLTVRNHPALLSFGRGCRNLAIWIFLCSPVIPLTMAVTDLRITATQNHCEKLIPRLEEWRQKTGHYPAMMSEIGESVPSRWLLGYDYYTSGDQFSFSIPDPSAMMNIWIYESGQSQWILED